MRKILLSLMALASSSVVLANQLDNGNYTGYLQQDGSVQDAATGKILNDSVDISIPTLTALGAIDGHLTGTIIQNDTNCIQNASFNAKKGFFPVSASSVVLTNCNYSNHIFSGNYDAVVFGVVHNKGKFSFTLQP
jgi:hypothetical protein